IEILPPEVEALRSAHPCCVEELEDRAVAHAAGLGNVRRLDERRHRLPRQRPGQRAPAPRGLEMLRGVALERPLTKQVTVESTHRRHPARDARGPEAAPPEPCQIRDEIVGRETCEGAAVAAEELGEVDEVAAVGGESISGRPLLRLQGAEIPNDDLGHRVTTSNLITAPTNRETAARAGVVEPLPAGALHAPGLLRAS